MEREKTESQDLSEASGLRQFKGITRRLISGLAILVPLIATFEILKIGNYFGFYPKAGAVLSLFLGFMMALIFLTVPARKSTTGNKVPWYDIAAAVFCVVGAIYLALVYEDFEYTKGVGYTPFQLFLGVMAVIMVLETTRRSVGWPMIILTAAFVLYAAFGNYIPGILTTRGYEWDRILGVLFVPREGMFGIATELAAGLLIVFILFGRLLTVTGMGEWFTGIANALVGHVRGGPAKISIIASLLLGMVQGSAAANVATTGVMTIPLMKKTGYSAHFAGAVEAVASVGGQISPPVMGMTAFLLAEFLDIPYASVAIAAAIPAFLYYLSVFIQVDLEAVRIGLKGLPREELPPLRKTFFGGIHYLFPIGVLLYLLIIKLYSPQTAAYYASGALILISILVNVFESLLRKENPITLRKIEKAIKKILKALEETSYGMFMVVTSCATSGLIISIVNLTGLGNNLSMFLVDMAGGSSFLLLVMTALTCTILGMGIPVIGAYIMLAILVAPALATLGIPSLAAHLFIFIYAVLSFLTPPVAPAIYVAMGIAKSGLWATGLTAMRLGIVAYLAPFIFVYNPAIILIGEPIVVIWALVTSVIGVSALAAGLEGYALGKLNWIARPVLIAAGLAFFIPGLQTDLLGALGIAIVLVYQRWRFKKVIGDS